MIYFDELINFCQKTRNYIESESLIVNNYKDARGETSLFWEQEFFKRKNYPSVNEITNFLRPEAEYLKAMGTGKGIDIEQQLDWHSNISQVICQFTPKQFILSLREPIFGNPRILEYDDLTSSAAFIMNAGTCFECVDKASKNLDKTSGLNIFEIGPGWGSLAQQLHQKLDVSSYSICDLPENLYLSSIYLKSTLPEKAIKFVETESPCIEFLEEASIYVTLPHLIDKFKIKFDLIINTFSLQEMNLSSVNKYVKWISEHLSKEGVFISINSHGKAGVKKASQYSFHDLLQIQSIVPFRKTPANFNNTIPYTVVCKSKDLVKTQISPNNIYTVCQLMQLGLDDNISDIVNKVIDNKITDEDQGFLDIIYDFFNISDVKDKKVTIDKANQFSSYNSIVSYLKGCLFFSMSKDQESIKEFQYCLEYGIKNFARSRAIVIMDYILSSRLNNKLEVDKLEDYKKELEFLSPNISKRLDEVKKVQNLQGLRNRNLQKLTFSDKTPSNNRNKQIYGLLFYFDKVFHKIIKSIKKHDRTS